MRTREVISRIKKFRDFYGFDIVAVEEIKTKRQAKEALDKHRRWLELTLTDALTGLDTFIQELGLEFCDIDLKSKVEPTKRMI